MEDSMKVTIDERFKGIRLEAETDEDREIVQQIWENGNDPKHSKTDDGFKVRTFTVARSVADNPASVELIPFRPQ